MKFIVLCYKITRRLNASVMFKFSVLSTLILTFCLGVSAQYKEEDLSLSIREINEKYYQGTNFYVGVAPGSSYLSPANKYAPDVKKVLNNQRDPSDLVWDKLKYTIKYLRSVAERVDGIGWQAHVSLGWENDPEKVEGLKRQIEWAHANHLEFHITELDVICPVDK